MSKNTKYLSSFIGLIVILLFTSILLSLSCSSRHNATAASDIINFTISGKGTISNISSTVESLIIKGSELFNKFKYQDAISYYDKALTITPNNVDALVGTANSLFKLNRYEESVSYYDKALDIQPVNVTVLYDKADALTYLGRYEEAIAVYDENLNPKASFT